MFPFCECFYTPSVKGRKILCGKEGDHFRGKCLGVDLGFSCSLTSQHLNFLRNEIHITLCNSDTIDVTAYLDGKIQIIGTISTH